MSQLELHPLCTLFPRLSGAEFDSLRDDIAANGLRAPIVTHDGMILDGGNRYRACLDAGVKPKFEKFAGTNLVSFVLSANLHRRHMTAGQQAAIVASATDWAKAQTHGGDRKKDQETLASLDTVEKRAAASGAGTTAQKQADKLVRESPSLAKEVTQGTKSLYRAVKETKAKKAPAKKAEAKREQTKDERIVELENRVLELKGELEDAWENARELADSLQGYVSAESGVKEAAAEIARLHGVVRVLEAARDICMTKNRELVKSIAQRDRKIDKLESGK